MSAITAQETCNYLSYTLEQILGVNGINTLGQYQLYSGETLLDTVPSIKIDYPLVQTEVVRKFVPESGIEITIVSQPDYVPLRFKGGNTQVVKYFQFILDQYHPRGVLDESIDVLYSQVVWDLYKPPIIVPARLKPDHSGVLPPRAIIHLRQHKFLTTSW